MKPLKRYKIKLNSPEKIEELLQELYNESCSIIEEIQQHINKINNSTELNDEAMDAKAKFAKSINDFIVSKDKAIGRKMEIAKLMSEILKYNGNIKQASEESNIFKDFNWEELQELAEKEDKLENNPQEYKLK